MGMIWVLFIMQLASHGTQAEETMQFVHHCDHTDLSDSQPISSQLNTVARSTECLASCEIKPVSVDGDNENIDANEETHLVIQDVPQCRICLDNEGSHHDLYYFSWTVFNDFDMPFYFLIFVYFVLHLEQVMT